MARSLLGQGGYQLEYRCVCSLLWSNTAVASVPGVPWWPRSSGSARHPDSFHVVALPSQKRSPPPPPYRLEWLTVSSRTDTVRMMAFPKDHSGESGDSGGRRSAWGILGRESGQDLQEWVGCGIFRSNWNAGQLLLSRPTLGLRKSPAPPTSEHTHTHTHAYNVHINLATAACLSWLGPTQNTHFTGGKTEAGTGRA